MKSHTEPIIPGSFYHIYNRGINGENLFTEARNYHYFLSKYAQYIPPVADTFAYSLLPNHFHLLVRIKDAPAILESLPTLVRHSAPDIVSLQFSHLFNGYAQAINKSRRRTGGLFETPFRRIPVLTTEYFHPLVHYIHCNAQRHGLVKDFRQYPYSSYGTFLSAKQSRIKRDEAMGWFGGAGNFFAYHSNAPLSGSAGFEREMVIEFD